MWESISSTVEDNVNSLVENWKIFWYEFGQGVEKIAMAPRDGPGDRRFCK